MTGKDFSNVLLKEDVEKKEIQIDGKLEFISQQISKYAQERDGVLKDYLEWDLKFPYSELIGRLDIELKENIDQANKIAEEKNTLTTAREDTQKRLNYNTELLNRFLLLDKQYSSDLMRLEFILEAESLSSQLGDAICPICSSKLDDNHIIHLKEIANFKESVREETNKTSKKILDLREAITRLKEEKLILKKGAVIIEEKIELLHNKLKENFTPKIKNLKTDLKNYWELENAKSKLAFIDTQVKNLFAEKNRLEKMLAVKEEREEMTLNTYSILAELAEKIQKRLERWNYESQVNVVFDSNFKIFDIVISGKSRRSYGKGKRAVSYSACILGLLDYCVHSNFPFCNLVVLDSPLTTYKGKDEQTEDGLFGHEIEYSFFEDLAKTPSNCQIIVFDNKIPDKKFNSSLHTVIFTKDKSNGRFGFFPNN